MKTLIAVLILALAVVCLAFGGPNSDTHETQSGAATRFLGTWKLVSIVSNGQIDPAYGEHPVGQIYYDGTGHMAAQIMPDRRRPRFAGSSPTPEEAKSAISGYVAYFGTFTVDEKAHTVTHHRDGTLTPGMVGVDLVRSYEFDSNGRLILTPVEAPTRHLTWERMK
jgi:hypothetical protein